VLNCVCVLLVRVVCESIDTREACSGPGLRLRSIHFVIFSFSPFFGRKTIMDKRTRSEQDLVRRSAESLRRTFGEETVTSRDNDESISLEGDLLPPCGRSMRDHDVLGGFPWMGRYLPGTIGRKRTGLTGCDLTTKQGVCSALESDRSGFGKHEREVSWHLGLLSFFLSCFTSTEGCYGFPSRRSSRGDSLSIRMQGSRQVLCGKI
jgi:hypothetical protein